MDAPVSVPQLILGPGERADVLIDFRELAGKQVIMRNFGKAPFPDGDPVDPETTGQIMAFRVSLPLNVSQPYTKLPDDLRPISGPYTGPGRAKKTRRLLLFEGTDRFGRLQTMLGVVKRHSDEDGTRLWDDPITETPRLNDVEIWEVYNTTADAHPIHVHLVAFQLLSRRRFTGIIEPKPMREGSTGGILTKIKLRGRAKPPNANETGPKDTVQMYPGEVTRIAAKFDREGEYVWHCHILSHEDNEMMRPYRVET
jgi:spore coat protein A